MKPGFCLSTLLHMKALSRCIWHVLLFIYMIRVQWIESSFQHTYWFVAVTKSLGYFCWTVADVELLELFSNQATHIRLLLPGCHIISCWCHYLLLYCLCIFRLHMGFCVAHAVLYGSSFQTVCIWLINGSCSIRLLLPGCHYLLLYCFLHFQAT